jgi:hypothetical protein
LRLANISPHSQAKDAEEKFPKNHFPVKFKNLVTQHQNIFLRALQRLVQLVYVMKKSDK